MTKPNYPRANRRKRTIPPAGRQTICPAVLRYRLSKLLGLKPRIDDGDMVCLTRAAVGEHDGGPCPHRAPDDHEVFEIMMTAARSIIDRGARP